MPTDLTQTCLDDALSTLQAIADGRSARPDETAASVLRRIRRRQAEAKAERPADRAVMQAHEARRRMITVPEEHPQTKPR